MNKHWKIAVAGVALLALAGGVTAAPKAGHAAGGASSHSSTPPASSNKQSLPDSDRGLDRANERESQEGLDHSQAEEQQINHAPNHGVDHRNPKSLPPHGKSDAHRPN
jgi:hypothetical protein